MSYITEQKERKAGKSGELDTLVNISQGIKYTLIRLVVLLLLVLVVF